MSKTYITYLDTEVGLLEIGGSEETIRWILFLDEDRPEVERRADDPLPEIVTKCVAQLKEYFAGTRKQFDLPLELSGTTFQCQVWTALQEIPYGQTWSYGELARVIKNPKAVRAVGGANNRNQLPIIIPCHRVIGKNGKLTGYGGGLWRKEWLLAHEKKNR